MVDQACQEACKRIIYGCDAGIIRASHLRSSLLRVKTGFGSDAAAKSQNLHYSAIQTINSTLQPLGCSVASSSKISLARKAMCMHSKT